MTELLLCPFCGEAPNCGAAYGHGEDEPNSFCFECPNGCSVSKEKPTYDEAVTVWNTRVPAQRPPILEATLAQHFNLPKGKPAQFVRNGILETCQCRDCAAVTSTECGEGK